MALRVSVEAQLKFLLDPQLPMWLLILWHHWKTSQCSWLLNHLYSPQNNFWKFSHRCEAHPQECTGVEIALTRLWKFSPIFNEQSWNCAPQAGSRLNPNTQKHEAGELLWPWSLLGQRIRKNFLNRGGEGGCRETESLAETDRQTLRIKAIITSYQVSVHIEIFQCSDSQSF